MTKMNRMNIKHGGFLIFLTMIYVFMGIPAIHGDNDIISPDALYQQANEAVENSRYEEAYYLFMNASEGYADLNNTTMKRDSLHKAKRINWMFLEMQLNRTSAEKTLTENVPSLSPQEMEKILESGNSIQFVSDDQTYYYEGIARNVLYHNVTLIREINQKNGESPFFDQVSPYIGQTNDLNNPLYQNHTIIATGLMNITRDLLPENGTLQVWLPLPIKTPYQHNISVISTEPAEYVVSRPITTGDIGEVYFEIPLEDITGEYLNMSVEVMVTSSPRINKVNPDSIQNYDVKSELYLKYTKSQPNINISPAIIKLAESIVGNETNPYIKAKLIYNYILDTLPYSNVPHSFISAQNISESDFVYDTGFGDCGTQSAYFAALCRAVGIPARTPGGYQVVPGYAGPHFWAEFYLPGYGWMPVDVTVAETGDWAYNASSEELMEFKEFYFCNMDPYRFTIQNDMDSPFSGEPNPDILLTVVHQTPTIVCSDCDVDVEMIGTLLWEYKFKELEKEIK